MKKTTVATWMIAQIAVAMPLLAADWTGDAELGYILLDGNSESETLNGKLDINRESAPWRNNFHFEATNSSSSDERTAEKYLVSGQLDYKLNLKSYLFSTIAYEEDKFSGFEYQALIAGGYGREFINNETVQLSGEIGPGYRVDKFDAGNDEEDAVLYVREKFSWAFSSTASLSQEISVEKGKDNTLSRFQVAVKSALSETLAMKVGYAIKYTEEVPVGIKHADTETTLTVAYSF